MDIIIWPDDRLKTAVDNDYTGNPPAELIRDMIATLNKSKSAIGLAATQVGTECPLFLMRDEQPHSLEVVFSPLLHEYIGNPVEVMEGCLSFPGIFEKVSRHKEIGVSYTSIDPITLEPKKESKLLSGLKAHVFQHELDHLNGVVFTDYLTPARAKTIKNKLNKWKSKGYRWP